MGACPFISEVSSSNVVSVTLLFIFFFQSISENHDSIDFLVLLLVNPTSTVAKKQVFLENLNASTLPWLLSSSRPPVFLFLSGVCFPGLYTQGQVEWSSKSLCAPQHPDFFLS